MLLTDIRGPLEVPVLALTCGRRAISITLFAEDIHKLATLQPYQLQDWLYQQIPLLRPTDIT